MALHPTKAQELGTPCIVCGAPLLGNVGHDDGCMAASDAELTARLLAASEYTADDMAEHDDYARTDAEFAALEGGES